MISHLEDTKKSTAYTFASNLPDFALAGVAQWIKHQPVNQSVAGSIPSQGPCLGCGPGPQGEVCKWQPHNEVSLPLFPSLKINKIFKKIF